MMWDMPLSITANRATRLAGGLWLVLVCSERKVLLAVYWWLVCSERKVLLADYWWLVCSERKVLLAGG
jgi:hypothetical protein